MFTGLVEGTGKLASREGRGSGFRMTVASPFPALADGESVSVAGACLTVTRFSGGSFVADVSAETARRTTLGTLASGCRVNLERSLRVGDRMGGHFVTGHVDGVARVVHRAPLGDATEVSFVVPHELSRFVAPKGSIAVDGVSLTVNRVDGDAFDVVLVPHTLGATTLGELGPGSVVNVEVDLVSRYVARLLSADDPSPDDRLRGLLGLEGAGGSR